MTAVIAALDYIAGYAVFGLLYWILNSIRLDIAVISTQNDVFTLVNYAWSASLVLYMIFGTFWFYTKLKEWEYIQR